MNYKHSFQMILVMVLLSAFTFTGRSHTAGVSTAWTIADLGWMAGDWQTDSTGRAVSEEHWTRPAGGSMLGVSRTLAGDRTASF